MSQNHSQPPWKRAWGILRTLPGRLTQSEKIRVQNLLRLELQLRPRLQAVPYWTAAVLVGMVSYFYSNAFSGAGHVAQHLSTQWPYAFLFFAPLCLVASVWVVDRFATSAGGSGIPQVITALKLDSLAQQQEIENILGLKTALVVVVSSLLACLGGGTLGNEGPMIQISAAAFYFIGKQFHRIWPYEEHRSWIIAGGAAGVAAAFNAPLAGVVFVIEELAEQHFSRFKTYVISAVVVAGAVSQVMSGRYLYFGEPKLVDTSLDTLGWAVALGVICGILARIFKRAAARLENWKTYRLTYRRIGLAAAIGAALALTAIFTDGASTGSGIHTIGRLLFEDGYRADWQTVAIRMATVLFTHLSGCAGGFLAPALTLGGTLGSVFSTVVGSPDHALFVMAGMAAFLSAITRAPFTAWVIVMEMTDKHSAIFALMIAALTGHLVASAIFNSSPASSGPTPTPENLSA